MKALKRPLAVISTLITVTLLLSWRYFDDGSDTPFASSFSALSSENTELTDEQMLSWLADAGDSPQAAGQPPAAAEDVLVQKIAGDNSHLLIMAFYSKENYAGPSITIENGFTITLRDDGRGADKKSRRWLVHRQNTGNVAIFRRQAVGMAQQMKASNFKPIRFIHREMVIAPDIPESFDLSSFDANQPASIAGLTNALSTDISPDLPPSSSGTAAFSSTTTPFSTDANALSPTTASALRPSALDLIKKNSVFITNLGVVEDTTRTWNYCTQTGNSEGPWTFGTLMRQLASKSPAQIATDAQVSDYVKSWISNWENRQIGNGDTVEARTLIDTKILNPWLSQSKNAGALDGQLDMKFAPFKLTAIVNRFDLRDGQKFSVPGSLCGEGRFVFCLVNSDCSSALPMTVIFEYGINKPNTCESQHSWAQQWVNLKNFTLGSSEYNQALQNITDQFTLSGTNTLRPNQSSLDQVRTNEVTLASVTAKTWELREFVLDSATGNLTENTVAQTPADKYNAQVINAEVQRMASFVNKNRATIKAGKNIVPLTWKGFPFLGVSSHVIGAPTGNPPNVFHWDGTDSTNKPTFIVDNTARSNFSLETCAGCHAGEAQTGFTHVDTAFFGKEASLSGFLTSKAGSRGAIDADNDSTNGIFTVKDAALRPSADNPTLRSFHDITSRAKDLKTVVSTTCGTTLSISSQLMFQPINMVD